MALCRGPVLHGQRAMPLGSGGHRTWAEEPAREPAAWLAPCPWARLRWAALWLLRRLHPSPLLDGAGTGDVLRGHCQHWLRLRFHLDLFPLLCSSLLLPPLSRLPRQVVTAASSPVPPRRGSSPLAVPRLCHPAAVGSQLSTSQHGPRAAHCAGSPQGAACSSKQSPCPGEAAKRLQHSVARPRSPRPGCPCGARAGHC